MINQHNIPNLKKRYLFKLVRSTFGAGMSFVSLPLVTRSLGPEQYGLFNFLRVFFIQIIQFLDVGTSAFYPKLSKRPGDKGILRFVVFYDVVLVFVTFFMLFALFFSGGTEKVLTTDSLWIVILSFTLVWLMLINQKMTNLMDAWGRTIPSEIVLLLMRATLTIGFVVLFIIDKLNLESYLFIQNGVLIIFLLFLFSLSRKYFPKGHISKSIKSTALEFKDYGIIARIIKGGKIGSNKGIGVDRIINLPRFTDKDLSAFKISKELSLDTFFLSFCSSGEDVCALRKLFDYSISVISKIESNRALNNLSSICKESDGILIDRGDLSRDVSLTKIAFAQSYILDTAKSLDVPAYVATNLVESMVENPEPTRAEINDIVHTLVSGADGLVLAAESAIGKYPIECVRVVSNLIKEVDNQPTKIELEYLLNPSLDNIIPAHGGHLVQQFTPYEKELIMGKVAG